MSDLPLVSVIIPSYNREKVIQRAVDSVLNQIYRNIELIVVDDCSTDNTIDILSRIEDKRLIVLRNEKNEGACVSRNKGILNSSGEYIAFLDSDDVWDKNKLENQVNYMMEYNYFITYTNYSCNNKIVELNERYMSKKNLYQVLLYDNHITTGILLCKRNILETNLFDEKLSRFQDWDLVLRLSRKYEFGYIHQVLTYQYVQKDSITKSTSHKKTYDALRRIYKKNEEEIREYDQLEAKWKWRMAIHSIFFDTDITAFKIAFCKGRKIKYFFGYIMAVLKMDRIMCILYEKILGVI